MRRKSSVLTKAYPMLATVLFAVSAIPCAAQLNQNSTISVLHGTSAFVLSISTDKEVYSIGEPIYLQCRFDNTSDSGLLLYTISLLAFPRHLTIHGPDGRLMRSQEHRRLPDEFSPAGLVVLPANGFWGARVNLLDRFQEHVLSAA